jgi:hypothetical protein
MCSKEDSGGWFPFSCSALHLPQLRFIPCLAAHCISLNWQNAGNSTWWQKGCHFGMASQQETAVASQQKGCHFGMASQQETAVAS